MNVSVLGAGIMGHSIALSFALTGQQVILYDVSEESHSIALKKIKQHVDILKKYDQLNLQEDIVTSNIIYTTKLDEAINQTDIVIEAVPEILEIKQQLYDEIGKINNRNLIVASNTSTFSLKTLMGLYQYPEKVCITHYFNPGHIVPLVELIIPEIMEQKDRSLLEDVLSKTGKEVVVLKKDIDGFIGNRLQAALLREALALVENGIADFEDVDKVIKYGPGLRWSLNGPFEIADFGGLDTWDKVLTNLLPDLSNTSETSQIIKDKNLSNELGTKTNRGIYDYTTVDLKDAELRREEQLIEVMKVKKRN